MPTKALSSDRPNRDELDMMISDLEAGPDVFRPSAFWAQLNGVHRRQLELWGLENFKRTVNTRYFNGRILGIIRHQLGVVADWVGHPDVAVFGARFPDPSFQPGSTIAAFNPPSAWIYKTFVATYADLVRRQDPLRLMERLEEPAFGNPFTIRHRGRDVSQDLCNSVHELYSIFGSSGGPAANDERCEVMELGAGYGRLAYVVLSAAARISYTIVDVPPALYVAQQYLTTVLPELPVFRYQPWNEFAAVRDAFERARLRFLLPHQAERLPAKSVDVFVNISSLHEMSRSQVERYFQLMDRICRGTVYTKQWRRSRAESNGVVFGEHDYPIPAGWHRRFHRKHPIQSMFFDALYDVGSVAADHG